MKTVILCGGLGTRLAEETDKIPKPIVKLGKIPIIHHIINYYKFLDLMILYYVQDINTKKY